MTSGPHLGFHCRHAFQQLMRRWSRLHPYNAVHFVQRPGPPQPERLAAVAAEIIGRLGIGQLINDPDDRHFRWVARPPENLTIETAPAVSPDRATRALADLASRQLNRAFAWPDDPSRPFAQPLPVRLMVLPVGDGPVATSHHLGLCYDHWLGDGWWAAWLLRMIATADSGCPPDLTPGPQSPSRIDSLDPQAVFDGQLDTLRVVFWTVDLIRELMRVRACYAPRAGDADNMTQHVEVVGDDQQGSESLERLRHAARRRGGRINDWLLAATAAAVAAHTRGRLRRRSRHDLALTSMVDLRPLAPPAARLAHRMGLYLAYFNVVVRSCDTSDFDRLLSRVATQTAHIKSRGLYLRSLVDLWVGDNIWPVVWPDCSPKRYRKHMPIAAGVSSFRLPTAPWESALGQADWPLSYHRVVPTGPNTPLAVAPTTFGSRLTVTLTARRSGFTPAQIAAITADLADRLARL